MFEANLNCEIEPGTIRTGLAAADDLSEHEKLLLSPRRLSNRSHFQAWRERSKGVTSTKEMASLLLGSAVRSKIQTLACLILEALSSVARLAILVTRASLVLLALVSHL